MNIDDLTINDTTVEADIGAAITQINIIRTMDGASTLELTLHDQERKILNHGLFQTSVRCTYLGQNYRLVTVNKSGPEVTLTFEEEAVFLLRENRGRKTVARKKLTRVQFARLITQETPGVQFYAPEASDPAPTPKAPPGVSTNPNRTGFVKGADVTVKGNRATNAQLANMTTVLNVGLSMKANDRVLQSSLMTIIDESLAINLPASSTGVGIFQQDPRYWKGLRNIPLAAQEYFAKAIPYEHKHPKAQLWEVCHFVQNNKVPRVYAKWTDEAKKDLQAFNRGDWKVALGAVDRVSFSRGLPGQLESTWDTLQRLANEVGWRCFCIGNTIYFVSDDWLYAGKPQAIWSEDDEGITTIDFNLDTGKRSVDASVVALASSTTGNPGDVIQLQDIGPASGKWLLYEIDVDPFSDTVTFYLRKPQPKLAEPALSLPSQSDLTDHIAVGQRVVNWALARAHFGTGHIVLTSDGRKQILRPWYLWGAKHGMSLAEMRAKPNAQPPFDCSSFATYAWAVNGDVYIGDGTFNMMDVARANPRVLKGTQKPSSGFEPGDLVFVENGNHVAIVINDGSTISAHDPETGIYRTPMYTSGIIFWCRWSTAVGKP